MAKVTPYWVEEEIAEGVIKYVPTTNIPDPDEMREEWCFGLPLTDNTGTVMPDRQIKRYIDAAIKEVERRLGIFLKPTVITCNAEYRGLEEGVDYDIDEPPYDYDTKAWVNYGFLQLRERPVIELTELKLVLPNNQIIMDFMTQEEWIKLQKKGGQLQIVPYAGDPTLFALAGSTMAGYPFITGAIRGNIPQMLYVSYVAGYRLNRIPDDVRNIIAKVAAIDLLGVASDAVMVGLSSLSTSIDGLSESVSLTASAQYATYGAHIAQFKKEVDTFFSPKGGGARDYERGITMTGM